MSAVTLPTLLLPADWPAVLTGHNADVLTSRVLPEFLSRQRWYADKEGLATTVDFTDRVHVVAPVGDCTIAVIDVSREGSAPQRYTLPLAIAWETNADEPLSRLQSHVLARVRRNAQLGVLYDGTLSGELPRLILNAVAQSRDFLSVANGYLACRPTAAFETFRDIAAESWRPLGVEQSNTSLLVDDRVIVKLYRRVQVGIHPEIEIGRFLTEVAHYSNAPRLLGSVELIGSDGSVTAIALVQEFVFNQGDGWTLTLRHLDRVLNKMGEDEAFDADGAHEPYWSQAEVLARCIGEMHRAFAIDVADPAFAPEATTEADIEAWTEHTAGLAAKARQILGRAIVSGSLSGEAMSAGTRVLDDWEAIEQRCAVRAMALAGTVRTRIHGDLHLGQVVVVGGDFYILDFEGEPLHTLEWRRSKYSPLRDVAGMIRSFDYAGSAALMRRRLPAQAGDRAASEREMIARWRTQTTARFIAAYRQSIAGCPSLPQAKEDFAATLDAFVLEKALYEVCYDAANRPGWLGIPLAGVGRLLDSASRRI